MTVNGEDVHDLYFELNNIKTKLGTEVNNTHNLEVRAQYIKNILSKCNYDPNK